MYVCNIYVFELNLINKIFGLAGLNWKIEIFLRQFHWTKHELIIRKISIWGDLLFWTMHDKCHVSYLSNIEIMITYSTILVFGRECSSLTLDGCITVSASESQCFCSTDLCNMSPALTSSLVSLVMCLITLLMSWYKSLCKWGYNKNSVYGPI